MLKRALSLLLAVLMTVSLCCTGVFASDTVTVKFVDKDGTTELGTATVNSDTGLIDGAAPSVSNTHDGFYFYVFSGWTEDGENVVDLSTQVFTADTTLKAVYNRFGELYEDPKPVHIPNDTSKEVNLMTEKASISKDALGITWIYKVEGVENTIIADNFIVSKNDALNSGSAYPAWQWGDPGKTPDGSYCYQLELNNGYYFLYAHDDVNGLNHNASSTDVEFGKFSIFAKPHSTYNSSASEYSYAREAVNTNENATVTMLGVVNDNLQPNVTFHGVDGQVIDTYPVKYTDVNSWFNFTSNGKHLQRGALYNGSQAFAKSGLTAPEKDGYVLFGWSEDPNGDKDSICEAIYYNVDLYPVFVEIPDEDKVPVKFLDADGTEKYVGYSAYGKLISTDYPTAVEKADDGVLSYLFTGWSVDGKNVVDVANYKYTGEVTFKPVFKTYGVIYDDPSAQIINGTDTIDLIDTPVTMDPASHGVTIAYKVEGAETEIIADYLWVSLNGHGSPASQWNAASYSMDGKAPNQFELNNGYYYIYLNQNINGTNGKTPATFDYLRLFASGHADKATGGRTPVNENENATVTILGVVSDNLAPTVTFKNGGEVLASKLVEYTPKYGNLGYSNGNSSKSCQEGKLLSPMEVWNGLGLAVPVKAADENGAYSFAGWVDINGDPVEAVYDNITVYADFKLVSPAGIYFEGETALDPVVLDASTEQVVWSGNVPLTSNNANGVAGFTMVFDIQGIESPIDPGFFNLKYNGSTNISNSWFWTSDTGWKNDYLREMFDVFDENGLYYAYIQCRMVDGTYFKSLNNFSLFKTKHNLLSTTASNTNENATFRLVAVLENNMAPTVEFYNTDRSLISEVTYSYTNGKTVHDGSVQDPTLCYAFDKLLTPSEFALTDVNFVLPTKESDGIYNYRLVWRNEAGEIVDGVYKSEKLYADFVTVEKSDVTVTFLDANGNKLNTSTQKVGANPVFSGTEPAKAEDADYTYTFAGWSLDGSTVVDFAEYTLPEEEVVFTPVYVSDLKLKADITVSNTDVKPGETVNFSFKLNRTDITTHVLSGTKEDITSGEVTVQYNGYLFTSGDPDADAAGQLTVSFTDIAEDGTIDATLALTAKANVYGKCEAVTGISLFAESVSVDVSEQTTVVAIVGNPTGIYFEGENALAPVVLGTSKQNVWEGFVPNTFTHINGGGGVTFIYKVDGVETAIDPGYWDVTFNGVKFSNSWFYFNAAENPNGVWNGVEHRAVVDIPENGYYYTYLPQRISQAGPTLIKNVTAFTLFNGGTIVNDNDNATLTMLAILDNNIAPTVTFRDEDGNVLGSASHKYTNGVDCSNGSTSYSNDSGNVASHGKLLTPTELYTAQVSAELPTKAEDALNTYKFAGWVDAEGNPVDAVYKNQDVYASFTATPKAVAKIGNDEYSSLENALADASDGATITLVADIVLTDTVIVNTRVILDLNGKTVSTDFVSASGNDMVLCVAYGAHLTVADSIGTGVIDGSKVLGAIKMTNTGDNAENGRAKLTVNGGKLIGNYYAISGNGGRSNTDIVINGGVITATQDVWGYGIFHPQNGTVIVNGGTISAATGIEMRAGSLTVFDGTIESVANTLTTTKSASGTTVSGAAIALSQHTTNYATSVVVNGGTLNGLYAFYQDRLVTTDAPSENISATIDAAVNVNGEVVAAEEGLEFVEENGKIVLSEKQYIEVTYKDGTVETFANILDAVPFKTNYDKLEGATIKLLDNYTGSCIRMMENDMVLDLNTFTYTINEGTGSNSSRTQGIQVSEEVKTGVTIKNGTIAIAPADEMNENWGSIAWMINSYSNLTLEDVVLDCTNLTWAYGNSAYAIVVNSNSNNTGSATLLGETSIVNFNEQVGGASVNNSGTTVVVKTEGFIEGAFENEGESIEIYSGSYSVDPSEFCVDGFVPVKNADGSFEVAELPVAIVTPKEEFTLTPDDGYIAWPSGDTTVDRPLEIVVNFKATDSFEEAQESYFAKWAADFYVTVDGLATDSIVADGCYLAGQYGDFPWIVIPMDGITVNNGVANPVVSLYDANLTYENICDYVRDFTASIHISPEILEANPDIKITLALQLKNPNDGSMVVVGEPAVYDAEDLAMSVAQIGNKKYTSLADAIADAVDNDVVTLLTDINSTSPVVIDKSITLDGNGKKLTSTGNRAINVDVNGEVTIKNLDIVGGKGCERGINVINKAVDLTIDNVSVSGVSHYAVHVATSAGAGTSVEISDSELSGYAALAVYGNERTVDVTNSKLEGINPYADNGNDFAAIAIGGKDITINVDEDSTVIAASTSGEDQFIIAADAASTFNAVVEIAATIDTANATAIMDKDFDITKNTIAFRAEYEDELYAEGYAVSDYEAVDGMICIVGVYVAENVQTGVRYFTVADALREAVSGQRVILLANTSETYVMVTPGVVLDMNGYELTADYVVGFKGSSVINGKNNADGKLIVAADHVSLDRTNAYGGYTYMPIYDAENGCYVFTMVSMSAHAFDAELNEYKFIPYMMSYANAYLDELDEIANSGVDIVLRLTWEDAEGTYTATQDFTYADEFVEIVIDSYNTTKPNNYAEMYYAVLSGTEVTLGNNVQVSFAVISDSGVEAVSNSISIEL